jgi:putative heme-binding domain-containing protein
MVRLFLASALQRYEEHNRWDLAGKLCRHEEDAEDSNLPLMIWFGIVDSIPQDPDKALALARETRIPLIRRFIVRRLAAEQSQRPNILDDLIQFLLESEDESSRDEILTGLAQGLSGFRKVEAPPVWNSWIEKADAIGDPVVVEKTRNLSIVFGEGQAQQDLMEIAKNAELDPKSRAEAIRTLAPMGVPEIGQLLLDLVNDRSVAVEAAKGLVYYSLPEVPNLLLGRYRGLGPEFQKASLATLSTRQDYAVHLVAAMKEGRIEPNAVSAYIARQIVTLGNEPLTKDFEGIWGNVGGGKTETRAEIEDYKKRLTGKMEKRNLEDGKKHFEQICASCHVLFGEGKTIGPDLTGGQRTNLDYVLENLLDPSAIVAEGFQMSTLFLVDDRVLTGVVVRETDSTVTLQTQEEEMTLERSEIEEIVPSKLSLMPEGLIQNLTDEELRDLLAYLMQ